MSNESSQSKLDVVIAQYIQSMEEGTQPSRELIIANHPELAEELRSFFSNHDLLAAVKPHSTQVTGVADQTEHYLGADALASAGHTHETGQRFEVLRHHARGGLGDVSLARDVELNREVALKEIQSKYANDRQSRLRFLLEAEVTGGLEHPGIVPVYALGSYEDGRPFYAMRFIRGYSLKDAIDHFYENDFGSEADRELEQRQLLGRFIDVCNAISFAHSKGILHRDIKPANIMVGEYGEAIVVDWGLAKRTGEEEDSGSIGQINESSTLDTQLGDVIGTPAYMSPEQAHGHIDQLNSASDVYCLGATLYHLLTGQAPIAGQTGMELLEKARGSKFERPSKIRSDIPKALEAVCLHAMSPDHHVRYQDARDLADDIERYLADEPVKVCKEPLQIRGLRWMRKHPAAVVGVTVAILVGTISLSITTSIVSSKNEQLTIANGQLIKANGAERVAKEEAEAVSSYLVRAFRSPDPELDGLEITIAEILDRSIKELEHQFEDEQIVKARLYDTFGTTYRGLGLPNRAVGAFHKSREIFVRELGSAHEVTLNMTSRLVFAWTEAGNPEEAAKLGEECLKLCNKELGSNHEITISLMANTGLAQHSQGNDTAAVELLELALLRANKYSLGVSKVALISTNLASVYTAVGRFDDAFPLLKGSAGGLKSGVGANHPDTLVAINNLATAYFESGQVEKAIELHQMTLDTRRNKLGDEHPKTMMSRSAIGMGYSQLGNFDLAIPLLEASANSLRESLGRDHPTAIVAMNNLATTLREAGNTLKSLEMLELLANDAKEINGKHHPKTLIVMNNLALALFEAGFRDRAFKLDEEILAVRMEKLGKNHPFTIATMNNLAQSYSHAGNLVKAIALLKEASGLIEAQLGTKNPTTITVKNNLAVLHRMSGECSVARQILEEQLQIATDLVGLENVTTLLVMNNLALAYEELNQFDKAIEMTQMTYRIRLKILAEDHPHTLASMSNLAELLESNGELEESEKLRREAVALSRNKHGVGHQTSQALIGGLAQFLESTKRVQEAEPFRIEIIDHLRQRAPQTIQLANALGNFGNNLLLQGRFPEAEKALGECLQMYEDLRLPKLWKYFDALCLLGLVKHGAEGNDVRDETNAEAEQLLVSGCQGMKSRIDTMTKKHRPKLERSIKALIEIYEERNADSDNEKAERWMKELRLIQEYVPR